ncbi:MAG: hypothetical protein FWC36_10550 [Spirochaetes bacterium]|nr:hypothetical protein [Spirochaetota bacterium]
MINNFANSPENKILKFSTVNKNLSGHIPGHAGIGASDKKNQIVINAATLTGLDKMPVDIFDGVYLGKAFKNALILCIDTRNFSKFLSTNPEEVVYKLIREFTTNLLACINHFGSGCSYYKLTGDGAIIIWEETTKNSVNEAISIFNNYNEFLSEDLFKPFPCLGLAGALVNEEIFKYEISAEISQLKYRDYVGYGINLACRLQTLAGINKLILNDSIAKSGFVSVKVDESPEILNQLRCLKGLKKEDRLTALFYNKK